MKINEVADGVYHITTETLYELASTFMRFQEFYESPFKEIRGHFFTHEQYMDVHVNSSKRSGKDDAKFTYFEDWAGFNVPGNVFNSFLGKFPKQKLWKKEQNLINLIRTKTKNNTTSKFYVIGTSASEHLSTIDHELSHAWFYLDPKYKREMLKILRKFPETAKDQLRIDLKKDGYAVEVYNDEMIAYMSTNPMTYTKDMFKNKKIPWDKILEFQTTFSEFKAENLD